MPTIFFDTCMSCTSIAPRLAINLSSSSTLILRADGEKEEEVQERKGRERGEHVEEGEEETAERDRLGRSSSSKTRLVVVCVAAREEKESAVLLFVFAEGLDKEVSACVFVLKKYSLASSNDSPIGPK